MLTLQSSNCMLYKLLIIHHSTSEEINPTERNNSDKT